MRLRYAVFGHPVAHSRSPRIHAAFAAQAGIELAYERIDAAPERFAAALDAFAREGGRGANVTLPHKAAALALCDTLAPRALRAGAVNTLLRLDDETGAARWHGDNTDGIGLVRDLRDRHGVVLDGLHVLLLGAGGAGAGVAPALLDAGIARLTVANRSVARACALVRHLDDARVVAWEAWPDAAEAGVRDDGTGAGGAPAGAVGDPDAPVDLVINATSAARGGEAPWLRIAHRLGGTRIAVDLGYGEAAAPFLDFARGQGIARRIDGLGMLVEQAAESFRLWHGLMPDTAPVHAALRGDLGAPP